METEVNEGRLVIVVNNAFSNGKGGQRGVWDNRVFEVRARGVIMSSARLSMHVESPECVWRTRLRVERRVAKANSTWKSDSRDLQARSNFDLSFKAESNHKGLRQQEDDDSKDSAWTIIARAERRAALILKQSNPYLNNK